MCRRGAAAATPSYASVTRLPVPVMMITSELLLVQPERSTISWMTEARSGVCWSGPASPVEMDQYTPQPGSVPIILPALLSDRTNRFWSTGQWT